MFYSQRYRIVDHNFIALFIYFVTSAQDTIKHETLNQFRYNVGQPSATMAQHYTNTGS